MIDDQLLTETIDALDRYIQALAVQEQSMTFIKANLLRLVSGTSVYTPPPLAANTVIPTIAGTAAVGETLTATQGTWTNSPTDYDRVWQVATDSPNFTQWTDIANSKSLTYVLQAGDVDDKVRYGERALTLGGWSAWTYSDPTGIVINTAPPGSAPTINTAGYFTAVGGGALSTVYVGDTIEIQAADITGETGSWYYLVRDGTPVTITPVATDQDTFPVSYVVTSEDISTNFQLQTVASNATGQTTALSADIGPITVPNNTGTFIDLGSRQLTEDFILANAPTEWTKSGSATWQQTVTSTTGLKNALTTVKALPLTGRYEITCDWDGISFTGVETTTILTIQGPAGTTGWADNGGWLHIKAATGKRPAIGNRVTANNCQGLFIEGVDLAGKYSGSGNVGGQYAFWIQRNATFNCPSKITLKNLGVGRYFRDNTEPNAQFISSIVIAGGLCDQLVLDGSAVHGSDLGIKGAIRLFITRNSDHTMPKQDFIGLREHVATGYYAYVIADGSTIRENLTDYVYRLNHKDGLQTGRTPNTIQNSDVHLGYRVIIKNCVWHAEHFYAGTTSSGGGSQGSYNDDHNQADNLFALYNNVILCTTTHAFHMFSPNGQYTSYVERCTFGRAGRVPSQFSPDTGTPQDYSPGISMLYSPNTNGTALKVVDSLIGSKYDASSGRIGTYVQFINTTVVNYTKTPYTAINNFGIIASDPSPEDVFNGRDFTRGGAAEANSIANKFGYILPNEATQAGFVSDIEANFTPQGIHVDTGATITPANYTSVTPPTGGG